MTAIAGFRPRRFWTQLQSVHAISVSRIISYWTLSMSLALSTLAGAVLTLLGRLHIAHRVVLRPTARVRAVPHNLFYYGPFISARWYRIALPFSESLVALELVWPWLTLASLMIFQISMRRKGIKNVHLLRCVLYSADTALWMNLGLLATAGIDLIYALATHDLSTLARLQSSEARMFLTWCILLLWAITCYRLCVAYKKYLRFDHVLATIIASQIIVALAIPTGLVVLGLL